MADVFSVLERDHQEVKSMLTQLESGPAGGGERKKLAERLVIEESKHEAVEEMYFWPAVRSHVDGGEELSEEAISQEQAGKRILDQLDKAEAGSAEFEQLVTRFAAAGREHIAFEEEQVWPQLRAVLPPVDAEQLGAQLAQAKASAPTRPHPHTPPHPAALKAAGPAVAAADKFRDAASGRG